MITITALLEKEIPLAVIELILLNFKINLNTTEQPQEALETMTLQKTTDSVLQKMHVHNIDVQLMDAQNRQIEFRLSKKGYYN